MKLRAKLLSAYVLMLAAVLAVGLVSLNAVDTWQQASDNLEHLLKQGDRSERLRAAIHRLTNSGLDYLVSPDLPPAEFETAQQQVGERLAELNTGSLLVEEADHIEGIEETLVELIWTTSGIVKSLHEQTSEVDQAKSRARLREIADEAADEVAVLNQYYRAQVKRSMERALQAGTKAAIVTGIAVAIALLELLALIFLVRRWLVTPMAQVNDALKTIATGDLQTKIAVRSADEWGELAESINEMTQSLQNAQLQLSARERFVALGEAAAYTAHNIRNPLASIRAAAQVTRAELGSDQSDLVQVLDDILQTVDRLNSWVTGFLRYAAPLEVQKDKTDANELVTGTVAACNSGDMLRSCEIRTRLAANLPYLAADAILLQQALVAVITNAVEAESSLVEVETSSANGQAGNQSLSIKVIDNGVGVSAEDIDRLSQAFVTSKKGGTGLGLPQARKIVELHGGQFCFDSAPGQGSTVEFMLPINIESGD